MPTLIYNAESAETDEEKATLLNKYFASQSTVNDNNKDVPLLPELAHEKLLSLTFAHQDVYDVRIKKLES